ncbi:glycosyltransferase family 2 protein [bacterium]|nr:glycosyltransferase family 2 protein [bacterium]
MDVSIVYVNYKSEEITKNSIKSVLEKTQGIEFEIFVVDNNSEDGSIENIEKEFPQINIIKNTVNAGFGAANNLAIRQAKGKYILCLNTDTILLNNAIKMMFDFMEKEENQNIGACGCYITGKDQKPSNCGGLLPSVGALFWKFGFRKLCPEYYEKKYVGKITKETKDIYSDLGYITGADLFLRKKVLDEVGLYDENIFMYFEDSDLCKRIKDKGYELTLVEGGEIEHLEGQSTKNPLNKKIWFKTSEMYYFRKHFPSQLLLVKLIYLILYLFDWLILRNKDSKELIKVVLNG